MGFDMQHAVFSSKIRPRSFCTSYLLLDMLHHKLSVALDKLSTLAFHLHANQLMPSYSSASSKMHVIARHAHAICFCCFQYLSIFFSCSLFHRSRHVRHFAGPNPATRNKVFHLRPNLGSRMGLASSRLQHQLHASQLSICFPPIFCFTTFFFPFLCCGRNGATCIFTAILILLCYVNKPREKKA